MLAAAALALEPLMNLTCNIDHRGAKARRIWGALCLAVALASAGAAFLENIGWLWILAAASAAAAALAFYEARKKWCVMRAIGIKTPL